MIITLIIIDGYVIQLVNSSQIQGLQLLITPSVDRLIAIHTATC